MKIKMIINAITIIGYIFSVGILHSICCFILAASLANLLIYVTEPKKTEEILTTEEMA
ncbi:MAG: hypothetical protein J6U54_14165 [Clostridiales bacterium]|nr:hypothetical protein [Clostridiales bacterium]